MLDSFLNCQGAGGGRGSIPVFLSKPTSLWSAKTRTRMCVCLSVCRVSGTPFPSSWSIYIGHMWFVCATMSHARDVVYNSEILGVAVHSWALPEGEGCGPMGNHNTIGFLSKNSKWVWSGNTTITNCRQSRGTARKSHSTITRHQEDKLSKSISSLFPTKMIAILEWT